MRSKLNQEDTQNKVIIMKENDKLRGLEIRFYLVCYDLIRLTKPMTYQNILIFFEFFEKIDFTKDINYDILKTLARTIFTEQTNIQPNKTELCNFCYTHKIHIKKIKKYVNIPKTLYDATISQIKSELFYQPTHLQPAVYDEIEKFLNKLKQIQTLGVPVDENIYRN
jgi:hypothetical protein